MADPTQQEGSISSLVREAAALDDVVAQAQAELREITDAASHADQLAEASLYENCSTHNVPGVGRYAVPNESGWEALIGIIHDRSVDVNFSITDYPYFDTIIAKIINSPYFDDPEDAKFDSEKFRNTRDNIAAVRNFIMQTYYAETPPGMTYEKAQQSMEQIANFVGEGLRNNQVFLGFIPYHDDSKPFIDINLACQPNGKGAQYIYERILEMQRQSSWKRPFSAVVALFGGKTFEDWMLPSAIATPFVGDVFAQADKGHLAEDMAAEKLANLQAEREALQQVIEKTALASDMDAMGNQLLSTASRLTDVSQLSEPVRQDAIEIAREILRKLKLGLGTKNARDALRLNPGDDVAAVGGVQGVAMVYERLLAWGRGIDAKIAQHPAIASATLAVGQLGYLAKLQALELAKSVGNMPLAERIGARIAQMPAAYKDIGNASFGELLQRVEGGIDTVLNRIQAIQGPGASVGHKAGNELGGTYMNAAPIAGQALQTTNDGSNRDAAGKRNAEILAAEAAVAQAQAARIQSQTAARAAQQGQQTPPAAQPRPTNPRQVAQQQRNVAQQQQRSSSTNNPLLNPNLTAAQRAAMMQRNAAMRASVANDHQHEEQHQREVAARQAAMKIDAKTLQSLKAATNATGLVDGPANPTKPGYKTLLNGTPVGSKATPVKPLPAANDGRNKPDGKPNEQYPGYVPPNGGKGSGRGF